MDLFLRVRYMQFKCPKCGKVIPSTSTDENGKKQFNTKSFPFCSERCKMVDMGAWFDGDYAFKDQEAVDPDFYPEQ
jgi:endogenous inhibitor of DNA gyrase (YacG/DUF329 family)